MVNAGGAFTVKVYRRTGSGITRCIGNLEGERTPPPPVGVPLITPVLLFKLNPGVALSG